MKLDLTNEQFENLLKTVFLGNWVINATKDPEERLQEYEDLFVSLVEHKKTQPLNGDLSPFDVFQQDPEIQDFLDEFVDDVFWEELIERLSKRDLIQHLGEDDDSKEIDMEKLNAVADGIALKYLEEFENNGLDNVQIENFDLKDFQIEPLSDQ